jgi:hypothetical protein
MTIIYPQLDGIRINENRTLPITLVQAIRKAYDYIAQVASFSGLNAVVIQDTHINRINLFPAGQFPPGSLYIETDRALTYIDRVVDSARAWVYLEGTYSVTQSQIAGVTGLTANDNGLRLSVTDYAHLLMWTNPAWGWAPEDDHRAGEITHFDVAPTGSGWKLINGNGDDGSPIGAAHPIVILKADGTTRNNTTAAAQNAGVFVRGAAAYAGGITAPTVPTVSALTFTGTADNTGVTAGLRSIHDGSGGTLVGVGTVLNDIPASNHIHPYTPSGTINTPTTTLPGPPVSYSDALPYIRK